MRIVYIQDINTKKNSIITKNTIKLLNKNYWFHCSCEKALHPAEKSQLTC